MRLILYSEGKCILLNFAFKDLSFKAGLAYRNYFQKLNFHNRFY
jgi:hypothetical protein